MIGRKNKGPSLAFATPALGGANGLIGAALGGIAGYLAGSFETLGGIIPSALTGSAGSLGTSVGSLGTSFGTSLMSWPVGYVLDMFSSSGVTSFPFTSLPSNVMSIVPIVSSAIIPSF